MEVVTRSFAAQPKGLRILDLPPGNGLLADALREMGHTVVCADINRERPEYEYVDMAMPPPYADGAFDAAVCLEGVEHLVDPVQLIRELVRVTRSRGTIVVSTPNVMSFYSRLHLLLTGVPYQFSPAAVPYVDRSEAADRGHVSPLSYFQLRYLFEHYGARVKAVHGDRYKKKALAPVYLLLLPFVRLATRWLFAGAADPRETDRNRELLAHALSGPLLFSRSLVLVLHKG